MRALLLILLASWCVPSISQDAKKPVPPVAEQAKRGDKAKSDPQPQQTITVALPSAVNVAVTGKLEMKSSDENPKAHDEPIKWSEWLVALFTGALVGVTAYLVYYTKRLWASTSDLVKDTKTHGEKELRAYLGVSRALFHVERGVRLVAEIAIKNAGKTPAKQCRLEWHYHIENAPTLEKGVDDSRGSGVLVPDFVWNQHLALDLRAPTYAAIENGSVIPVMWGRIDYVDTFDNPRWTTFCFSAGRQVREGWDVQAIDHDEHRNDAN